MKLKLWRSLLLGLCLSNASVYAALKSAPQVQAQISPDGTTNTNVDTTDNVINIEGGDKAGDNLFHSLEEFSVPNGSEAFFNNQSDIVNIFSRVTGGDISNIDGLIRANGDASLFIINPAGIIFGEGASLDLGGSFTASTADSIIFSDDVEFSATPGNNPPLLTINQPIGLNYGNNPGSLAVNNSNLQVDSGETLALLGGDVTITGGQIIAPGANIELGGLSQAGQVSFVRPELTDINFNSTSFPEGVARGDITLTNGTNVNVQAAGGGNIQVNARNLELSNISNLTAGIAPEFNSTEAQAGDIILNATEDITVSQVSRISNRVEELGVGNSGEIDITAANFFLTEQGQLDASTAGQGDSGAVTIKALETIFLEGLNPGNNTSETPIEELDLVGIGSIVSQVEPTGTGDSGGINLTTTNLSLRAKNLFREGSLIVTTTFGQGNAGSIEINASDTISIEGGTQAGFNISGSRSPEGVGNSGDINITTANLFLKQGGALAANTFGQGDAGAITIDASDTIAIEGEGPTGYNSGIFSNVVAIGEGDGGRINITTANLFLKQGGQVSSSTIGQGDAGVITIEASETIYASGSGTIFLDRTNIAPILGREIENLSGIFSRAGAAGRGNAADIDLNTSNLSVANGAQISTQSLGQGNAGDLLIQADTIALSNGAALFASTPVGAGGNIKLEIAENIILQEDSTISAQALENANGGNIEIEADFVIADTNQNSDIIASAAEGTGGDINITTNAIFGLEERSSIPDNNTNDLDASSELGIDGTIQINELEVNPTEALEELPVEVIDVTGLVEQNLCQQGQGSEFVVTGKGGTAPSPTQARDGSVSEVDLVKPVPFSGAEEATQEAQVPEGSSEIVEARGWVVNDRGMVELVASKTDVDSSPVQPKIQCRKQ